MLSKLMFRLKADKGLSLKDAQIVIDSTTEKVYLVNLAKENAGYHAKLAWITGEVEFVNVEILYRDKKG